MNDASKFRSEVRQVLRERALETARQLVCTEGWGAVSMSRVAREVGISRPVLYKELGSKDSLAQAIIEREVDIFMAGIADTLTAYPADPVTGLTAASAYALRNAAENILIKAVLSGRQASDTVLLPVLVTEPGPVLIRALDALTDAVRRQYGLPAMNDANLRSMVEIVVRMTLSHMFQPLGTVEHAVEQIAAVIAGIFGRTLAPIIAV
ncbi:TetR family transcriptional regulator [Nocardia sp. NPDC059228]|uniref:TetR/AcrR family transcriptional regulator n=1 Tax=Nocardia sp. NPDC059228 TaxID=3346777 RepID=UPI0036CF9705